ncbi:uncharacterized protein LOC128220075 [Mya arenaria]|uniref:uncharacterized protein LOC128220075 n=1 Tax=Mya arenaria TaxID=6604 RepID=UPI0022E3C259|nr:uncharacterized protein LOC128220075 [Mya arenaria]
MRDVFQPEKISNQVPMGQIVEAAYCPGGDNRSGVDAVLFRIENRFPLSGGSPFILRKGEYINPAFSFETGKICGTIPFSEKKVSKFGAATELTEGILEFEEPFVCFKTMELKWMVGDYQLKLFNQYQVRSAPGDDFFANPGDSGALVLAKDLDKKNLCIGIVEGGQKNSQVTCVSPVQDVLEQFKIRNFKQFENEKNTKDIVHMSNKIDQIEATLQRIETKINAS